MDQIIFQQLKNELINGSVKKGHPFRYFSLASVDELNQPKQRTVVLRKTDSELALFFYTDKRSKKISELQSNPNISALFYNPKNLLQLQVEGTIEIIRDEKILQKFWNGIPLNARKDYTTKNAPGSSINNPDNIEYLKEENNFCIVKIIPNTIEYLRLQRPNHLRVKFSRENRQWNGQFLVP